MFCAMKNNYKFEMLVEVETEGKQTGNPLWRFFEVKLKVSDMLGKLEIEENKLLLLTPEQ